MQSTFHNFVLNVMTGSNPTQTTILDKYMEDKIEIGPKLVRNAYFVYFYVFWGVVGIAPQCRGSAAMCHSGSESTFFENRLAIVIDRMVTDNKRRLIFKE